MLWDKVLLELRILRFTLFIRNSYKMRLYLVKMFINIDFILQKTNTNAAKDTLLGAFLALMCGNIFN